VQLICPKCEMTVENDDDGAPEKRRPVRCGSCGESWFTGGKTDLYALSFSKPTKIDPEVARQSTETKDQTTAKVSTGLDQDSYASLTWRQRGLVLLLGLLCALTALYVYAPNVAKTFPSMADWIFSYVFLVNDGRQVLSETLQSWDDFLISLNIAGNAVSAKDWFVGTVQAIIDFGFSLVGSPEPSAKD
jgi:hypothetical protein